MSRIIDELKRTDHKRYLGGLDFFKYIGPGLLVTVGFIDPGNWASNFAAGSEFGYALLWVVTLSTIMLIVLQHNVAHLGIVTGLCLSEAATQSLSQVDIPSHFGQRGTGLHIHFAGGDIGRSHCLADAFGNSHCLGICPYYDVCRHYAFFQFI